MIFKITVGHKPHETFKLTSLGSATFFVEVRTAKYTITEKELAEAKKKIMEYLEPYEKIACSGSVPWGKGCFPCNCDHFFVIELLPVVLI